MLQSTSKCYCPNCVIQWSGLSGRHTGLHPSFMGCLLDEGLDVMFHLISVRSAANWNYATPSGVTVVLDLCKCLFSSDRLKFVYLTSISISPFLSAILQIVLSVVLSLQTPMSVK